ncbi:MAG: fumarate reductase subunit D [Gammaproteobacteria bacterium]|nr:fumarate reductase subunit D [Gammaproteobacteria bacterium]TVQ45260.1 MAG: fumarate reductase subunit D [Gammaproteobacteria bacterium]
MNARFRRSHEPLFWLLFGAGGLLAALVLPALVLFTGVIVPVARGPGGEGLLDYTRVLGLLAWPGARVALAGSIALLAWHAAHRILHLCHDLGVHAGRGLKWSCYGSAALVSLLACGLVILLPSP